MVVKEVGSLLEFDEYTEILSHLEFSHVRIRTSTPTLINTFKRLQINGVCYGLRLMEDMGLEGRRHCEGSSAWEEEENASSAWSYGGTTVLPSDSEDLTEFGEERNPKGDVCENEKIESEVGDTKSSDLKGAEDDNLGVVGEFANAGLCCREVGGRSQSATLERDKVKVNAKGGGNSVNQIEEVGLKAGVCVVTVGGPCLLGGPVYPGTNFEAQKRLVDDEACKDTCLDPNGNMREVVHLSNPTPLPLYHPT